MPPSSVFAMVSPESGGGKSAAAGWESNKKIFAADERR
jgi:hypothetical protein